MNNDMEALLALHLARYSQAGARDLLKLVYQNEFGCGHLVTDEDRCLSRLKSEYATAAAGFELCEPIGNGYARLHLGVARAQDYAPELLTRVFMASALRHDGLAARFLDKAETVRRFADADETAALIEKAVSEQFAPFSHTEVYRRAYRPAYRVILSAYGALLPLIKRVESARRPVVIGLDGRCGAGKTTAAHLLEQVFKAEVIHMDDFFLPLELRTPERMAEPGGNVHYERFEREAANALKHGEAFHYGVFDCECMRVTCQREIPRASVYIVEGSYALHPRFAGLYDLRVMADIDPAAQLRRIRQRNGEEALINFKNKWIPMEERYLEHFHIRSTCDYLLTLRD